MGKFYPVLGGVEKVMFDFTSGLSEAGVECDMMCATSDGRGSEVIELNPHGRVVCCKTWLKKARTTIAPSMITKLRRMAEGYDIIHIHHPDPMAAMALMLSGFRGKVVLHWHSDILSQKTLLKFYLPIQNWLIKRADAIVGTSPVYLAESPYLQKVQDKTRCIPIGIVPNRSDIAKVQSIRNEYAGRKIIFSLGRLVEYKGYRYLIEAAKYFDDSHIILIGGGGPLKDELQSQIDGLGVGNCVKLLGKVSDEDLPSYLSRDAYADQPITGGYISGWSFAEEGTTSARITSRVATSVLGVQDYYHVEKPEVKVKAVSDFMDWAADNASKNAWTINHTSGYTGILSTDNTYRENAANNNPTVYRRLIKGECASTGMVMMDWVGDFKSGRYEVYGDLLPQAIIDNNFRK